MDSLHRRVRNRAIPCLVDAAIVRSVKRPSPSWLSPDFASVRGRKDRYHLTLATAASLIPSGSEDEQRSFHSTLIVASALLQCLEGVDMSVDTARVGACATCR